MDELFAILDAIGSPVRRWEYPGVKIAHLWIQPAVVGTGTGPRRITAGSCGLWRRMAMTSRSLSLMRMIGKVIAISSRRPGAVWWSIPQPKQDCAMCWPRASGADVVIKASGVGVYDDALLEGSHDNRFSTDALRLFWDVDAPATLADIVAVPDHPLRRALPHLDAVLTYGGGDPVITAYSGARCVTLCAGLQCPGSRHRIIRCCLKTLRADLTFLGNRLPDRERRVDDFFSSRRNGCKTGDCCWEVRAGRIRPARRMSRNSGTFRPRRTMP